MHTAQDELAAEVVTLMADLGRRLVQLQRHLLETLEPPQQRQLQHTIEHSSAHLEAMDLRAWSARQR